MAEITKWRFPYEQLKKSPSRADGYDFEKELSYRQQAANFIKDVAERGLKLSLLTSNTAIVYMHRFYVFHSFKNFHRYSIAVAALFLAAKAEEQPRFLEDVIKTAHFFLNKEHIDVSSPTYKQLADELILNEQLLLTTLGFEVTVEHPHKYILQLCSTIKATKELSHACWCMASYMWHLTTMCLQHSPRLVACASIYLSCEWMQHDIPSVPGTQPWYSLNQHINMELINKLKNEFLHTVNKCPKLFKNKLIFSQKFKLPVEIVEKFNAIEDQDAASKHTNDNVTEMCLTNQEPKLDPYQSNLVAKKRTFSEMNQDALSKTVGQNIPNVQVKGPTLHKTEHQYCPLTSSHVANITKYTHTSQCIETNETKPSVTCRRNIANSFETSNQSKADTDPRIHQNTQQVGQTHSNTFKHQHISKNSLTNTQQVSSSPLSNRHHMSKKSLTSSQNMSSTPLSNSQHMSSTPLTNNQHMSKKSLTSSQNMSSTPLSNSQHMSSTSLTNNQHMSKKSLSSSQHMPSTPLTNSQHMSSTPLTNSQNMSKKSLTSSQHMSSTSFTNSQHMSSTPLTNSQHMSKKSLTSSQHMSSTPLTNSQHMSSTPPTNSQHMSKKSLTSSQHMLSTPLANIQHVSNTSLTNKQHIQKNLLTNSQQVSNTSIKNSQHMSNTVTNSQHMANPSLTNSEYMPKINMARSQSNATSKILHRPPSNHTEQTNVFPSTHAKAKHIKMSHHPLVKQSNISDASVSKGCELKVTIPRYRLGESVHGLHSHSLTVLHPQGDLGYKTEGIPRPNHVPISLLKKNVNCSMVSDSDMTYKKLKPP